MTSLSVSDSGAIRALLRHSAGRRFLSVIGHRYTKLRIPGRPFEMLLDNTDRWGVSKYILKHGDYDRAMCDLVLRRVPRKSVCLDIGGNIGFWSCFLAGEAGASRVIAIEPEPHNLKLLRENLALNSLSERVTVLAAGAGAKPGKLELFLSKENAGDHQLYDGGEGREKISVEVVRLDDRLPGILKSWSDVATMGIDFIKIDVQGYEAYVFEGLRETLAANPQVQILMEYWPAGMKRAGSDARETMRIFTSLGFKLHVIEPSYKEVTIDELDRLCPEGHHVDIWISRS